jgi:hypothetical protein
VRVEYPPRATEDQLGAGIAYMKWLRSAYPECATSVQDTLRHYGMGRGGFLKWRDNRCQTAPCSASMSVWRAECGCGRPYSSLVVAAARRHPELHTVKWWGS